MQQHPCYKGRSTLSKSWTRSRTTPTGCSYFFILVDLHAGKEALMAGLHQNSPSSLWERIVLWATAIAEAAEMDTFGYLVGRIDHLERRIATLESSDRCAASPKPQRD
jgi:hypothetical protein